MLPELSTTKTTRLAADSAPKKRTVPGGPDSDGFEPPAASAPSPDEPSGRVAGVLPRRHAGGAGVGR